MASCVLRLRVNLSKLELIPVVVLWQAGELAASGCHSCIQDIQLSTDISLFALGIFFEGCCVEWDCGAIIKGISMMKKAVSVLKCLALSYEK